MPNTKSAKKRLKQNKARRADNRSIKSAVKTQIKKVTSAVDKGELETAEKELAAAARALDKAGSRGVLHKNTVARRKSRLQARIKKAKA